MDCSLLVGGKSTTNKFGANTNKVTNPPKGIVVISIFKIKPF